MPPLKQTTQHYTHANTNQHTSAAAVAIQSATPPRTTSAAHSSDSGHCSARVFRLLLSSQLLLRVLAHTVVAPARPLARALAVRHALALLLALEHSRACRVRLVSRLARLVQRLSQRMGVSAEPSWVGGVRVGVERLTRAGQTCHTTSPHRSTAKETKSAAMERLGGRVEE